VVHTVVAFAPPAIATLDVGVQSEGGSVRVPLARQPRGTVRQTAGVVDVAHRRRGLGADPRRHVDPHHRCAEGLPRSSAVAGRRLTYQEIRQPDAGCWKSPRFTGEKIPTLSDAIEVIRHTRAGVP
jgi:hypothetical protein